MPASVAVADSVWAPSTTVVVLCVALATYGASAVWRALPEAHTGLLGAALTLVAVMLTRPYRIPMRT